MDIKYVEHDYSAPDATIRYWFLVDGETVGVAEQEVFEDLGDAYRTEIRTVLIDSEGYPVDPANDHQGVLYTLRPHVEAVKRRAWEWCHPIERDTHTGRWGWRRVNGALDLSACTHARKKAAFAARAAAWCGDDVRPVEAANWLETELFDI